MPGSGQIDPQVIQQLLSQFSQQGGQVPGGGIPGVAQGVPGAPPQRNVVNPPNLAPLAQGQSIGGGNPLLAALANQSQPQAGAAQAPQGLGLLNQNQPTPGASQDPASPLRPPGTQFPGLPTPPTPFSPQGGPPGLGLGAPGGLDPASLQALLRNLQGTNFPGIQGGRNFPGSQGGPTLLDRIGSGQLSPQFQQRGQLGVR